MAIPCPKCSGELNKSSKTNKALTQQQRLLPQFVWALFVCGKCAYESVRIIGKPKS